MLCNRVDDERSAVHVYMPVCTCTLPSCQKWLCRWNGLIAFSNACFVTLSILVDWVLASSAAAVVLADVAVIICLAVRIPSCLLTIDISIAKKVLRSRCIYASMCAYECKPHIGTVQARIMVLLGVVRACMVDIACMARTIRGLDLVGQGDLLGLALSIGAVL